MNCPTCGQPTNPGSAFCGKCGTRLAVSAPRPAPMPQPSPAPGPMPTPRTVPTPRPMPMAQQAPMRQPAPLAPPMPAAPPAPGAGGTAAARMSPRAVKWLGAAAFAVIIVVASLLTGSPSMAGRSSSPQQLADTLAEQINTLYGGDVDSEAYERYADQALDLIPPQVLEAALDRGDVTREEAAEKVASKMQSALGSNLETVLDHMDVTIRISVDEHMDRDRIDDLEEDLSDDGVDIDIDDAVSYEGEYTYVCKDDYGSCKTGDTKTMSLNFGMGAIEVDGRWYLSPEGLFS